MMMDDDGLQTVGGSAPVRRTARTISLPEGPLPLEPGAAPLAGSRLAVLKAPGFVAEHFHEKFAAKAIARHCELSRFQFSRSFHEVFGITFREYLLRYRIREACRRLRIGAEPVTRVAYAVGFHDGSYFARMFRRYTGVLPSHFTRLRD